MDEDSAGKKGKLAKVLTIVTVVAVLGAGGYFGFVGLSNLQGKANEKRKEMEKRSDGGEMGHIANLYDVLDATEPGGRGLGRGKYGSGPSQRAAAAARPVAVGDEDEMGHSMGTLAAPTYTLDLAAAAIPEGRANGTLAGTNFVVDVAQVEVIGTAQVLKLIQGSPFSANRETLVYIQLKSGGTLAGHTWSVGTDPKGAEVVQVTKVVKPNPKATAEVQNYNKGFVVKLEIGQGKDGFIPGKIYLSFPDKEKSVVAGSFTITPPPKPIHFRDSDYF